MCIRDRAAAAKAKETTLGQLTLEHVERYAAALKQAGICLLYTSRTIGGEPVVYPYRNECCGGYISLKEKEMSHTMCSTIMDSASGFGAELLITACPLCLYNLNQSDSNGLPVYYFTELLAQALGCLLYTSFIPTV